MHTSCATSSATGNSGNAAQAGPAVPDHHGADLLDQRLDGGRLPVHGTGGQFREPRRIGLARPRRKGGKSGHARPAARGCGHRCEIRGKPGQASLAGPALRPVAPGDHLSPGTGRTKHPSVRVHDAHVNGG